MRITVLVDNAPAPQQADAAGTELGSEWGLSLLVASEVATVLLDFGQSVLFARNATALGIDLATVDAAVLSHAHYDHADGMEAFFEANEHAPLYLSEACGEDCWSTKGGTTEAHYIGIREGLLERHAERLRRVKNGALTTVAPQIHIVPHSTPGLERKGARDGMLLQTPDGWQADGFAHEVSVVLELGSAGGIGELAVLNSCSHAGVATIASEVKAAFPGRRIAAFVGGLHLKGATDEEVLGVASDIEAAGIGRLYTGHCTGERALELLEDALPGRVVRLFPGLGFEL